MTHESQAREALPVRRRVPLPGGRHRRARVSDLPPDRPALVLAVPGAAGDAEAGVSAEIATLTRSAFPHADVRLGHLEGTETTIVDALADLAAGGSARTPAAVVVPLVTGPHPQMDRLIREAIAETGAFAVLTEPLGPHPALAEALHVRLAASGLARADRIRLLGIATGAEGVIVATVGGESAARAADVTTVLLASRLAVPVVSASLDGAPGIDDAARRLREAGVGRLAISPCVIGPEVDSQRLETAATEAAAECAAPLGAYPGLVRLVAVRYEIALEDLGLGSG
ncbi:MAG: sirohydrochlorin chelatase, partial [Streptosporangiaceae bacterium]